MIAIIFEVTPNEGMADDYLKIAGEMRGFVERIDGFISVERFQSLTNPDKLLSISFFESEPAVEEWRQLAAHRSAQNTGRKNPGPQLPASRAAGASRLRQRRPWKGAPDSLDVHG